jgi:uncharacterized protein DUF1707
MFGREAPVTAGPGDWQAAAGRRHGHVRATHADREHVITTLKAAFVQGRLTKDELDERVGQTLASWTYGELIPLTADIPAGLVPSHRVREPARRRARPLAGPTAKIGACLVMAVAPAVVAAAFVTTNESLFKWLISVMIIYYLALMVTGTVVLAGRQHGRVCTQAVVLDAPQQVCPRGRARARRAKLDARRRGRSHGHVPGRAAGSRRTANR